MKELKFKILWAVDCQSIQWGAFQYKKEAVSFANRINGIVLKRRCLTDKYNNTKKPK
jgi:hypothetical protein